MTNTKPKKSLPSATTNSPVIVSVYIYCSAVEISLLILPRWPGNNSLLRLLANGRVVFVDGVGDRCWRVLLFWHRLRDQVQHGGRGVLSGLSCFRRRDGTHIGFSVCLDVMCDAPLCHHQNDFASVWAMTCTFYFIFIFIFSSVWLTAKNIITRQWSVNQNFRGHWERWPDLCGIEFWSVLVFTSRTTRPNQTTWQKGSATSFVASNSGHHL